MQIAGRWVDSNLFIRWRTIFRPKWQRAMNIWRLLIFAINEGALSWSHKSEEVAILHMCSLTTDVCKSVCRYQPWLPQELRGKMRPARPGRGASTITTRTTTPHCARGTTRRGGGVEINRWYQQIMHLDYLIYSVIYTHTLERFFTHCLHTCNAHCKRTFSEIVAYKIVCNMYFSCVYEFTILLVTLQSSILDVI